MPDKRIIGKKKSKFIGQTTVSDNDTFDFVTPDGNNIKIKLSDLIARFGTTGSIVPLGNGATSSPVLDIQGTVNRIRNLRGGTNVDISLDTDGALLISQDFTGNLAIGNLNIAGDLTVGGNQVVLGDLSVGGNIILSCVDAVDGDFSGNLTVAGQILNLNVAFFTRYIKVKTQIPLVTNPGLVIGQAYVLDTNIFYNIENGLDFSDHEFYCPPGSNIIIASGVPAFKMKGVISDPGDGPAAIVFENCIIDGNGVAAGNSFFGSGFVCGLFRSEKVTFQNWGAIGEVNPLDTVEISSTLFLEYGEGLDINPPAAAGGGLGAGIILRDYRFQNFVDRSVVDLTLRGQVLAADLTRSAHIPHPLSFAYDFKPTITLSGQIKGNSLEVLPILGGGAFAPGSLDQTSPLVDIQQSNTIPDSTTKAAASFTGNALETVISAIDTPVKINAIWGNFSAENFTVDATGTFTYIATAPLTAFPIAIPFLAPASGGITKLSSYIAKNSNVVLSSQGHHSASSGAPDEGTAAELVDLVTNDTLEAFVENNDNTVNIIASAAKYITTKA